MDRNFARAVDAYHVYRPVLDLLGRSEGTDKGDGYNETLAYGAYTGGDIDLVSMTLTQVDALQTKMLQHPKNKLNSSAVGRYQIVRTTMRAIRNTLGLTGKELFDRDMQDRMACFLLGQRGIDKWLAGRLGTDTLLTNLAKEWASLPAPSGKGYYSGQRASVTVADVKYALSQVRERHMEGQPKQVETVEIDRPVVPETVEEKVKEKTGLWQKLTGFFGAGGVGGGLLWGVDWQTLAVIAGAAILALLLIVLLQNQIVGAIKKVREGLA